jgi:hypothetical protein
MSATLIAVLAVEGARPKGLVDRLGRPFDKSLAKKGGADDSETTRIAIRRVCTAPI